MIPGPNIYDLLEQREVWYGRAPGGELREMRLEEMSPQYRANLANWLRKQATRMHNGMVRGVQATAARMQGEQAEYEMDKLAERLDEEDPLSWLRDRPLYQALTSTSPRRARHRDSTPVPRPPDPLDEETRPPEDLDDEDPPGYSGGVAELGYEGDG